MVETLTDGLLAKSAEIHSITVDEEKSVASIPLIPYAKLSCETLQDLAFMDDVSLKMSSTARNQIVIELSPEKETPARPRTLTPEIEVGSISDKISPYDVRKFTQIMKFITSKLSSIRTGYHKQLFNGKIVLVVEVDHITNLELRDLAKNKREIESFTIYPSVPAEDEDTFFLLVEFMIV